MEKELQMQEWNSQDEFNSYNSWKGLHYLSWYESIKKWKITRNPLDLKVPIEASIDPSPNAACNLLCKWCNAFKFLKKTDYISDQQIIDLHKFLLDWGCLAF
mgnify:FL=1